MVFARNCHRRKDKTDMPTESQDFNLTRKYHHHIAEKALGIVLIHKNVMQVHVIVVELGLQTT